MDLAFGLGIALAPWESMAKGAEISREAWAELEEDGLWMTEESL